jgi:ABC-type nickel/cobalt efflux system permease component RcnA
MRLVLICLTIAAAAGTAVWMLQSSGLTHWVVAQQRAFQSVMADGVFGLKTGSPGAWGLLLGAAASYGFVHALGPGHGKYLIGGVGLGASVSTLRLTSLALISSLAQALWAIALVYGGFFLLELSAERMTNLAEDVLAPISYAAIGLVGAILIWRGLRALAVRPHHAAAQTHDHDHDQGDCGCHSHGPTPDQAASVASVRDAVVLVTSIAVRPCTGAIFLLVIAWQMDIQAAGAAAAIVMGLGTAALTSLVALSSVTARRLALTSALPLSRLHVAVPALQVVTGAAIAAISLALLARVR